MDRIRINRLALLAFSTLIVGAVCHFAAKSLYSQSLVSTRRVPVTVSVNIQPVGGIPSVATIAYRSDGSTVTTGREPEDESHIMDVQAKRSALFDPLTKLVTYEPIRDATVRRMSLFPARCEEVFGIEAQPAVCEPTTENKFGYNLTRVRFVFIDQTRGTRTDHEYFVIPELTFIPVVENSYADGLLIEQRFVTSLVVGEPDPQLFLVPSEYTETAKPSEYFAAGAIQRKRAVNSGFLKMMDDKYERIKRDRANP